MPGQSTLTSRLIVTPRRSASRDSSTRSAGRTSILVGMQPTLRQVPPNVPSSTMAMSSPSSSGGRSELPDPVPMMIRSWWVAMTAAYAGCPRAVRGSRSGAGLVPVGRRSGVESARGQEGGVERRRDPLGEVLLRPAQAVDQHPVHVGSGERPDGGGGVLDAEPVAQRAVVGEPGDELGEVAQAGAVQGAVLRVD